MDSLFYNITGSIGDSLEKINTNYLNLDLLIGDENNTESFTYKTKHIEVLYNMYDKYKNIFSTLIERWDQVESFCTNVESNSAKWLSPYVYVYPNIENSKYFLSSPLNQNQILTKIINWLNLAYPVSLNIGDCTSSANYVEDQIAYVQFYLYVDNSVVDEPSADLTSDSGYCTTMEYETCLNCSRIYHGYTFCGVGEVFNCEGASIDFTQCGTIQCTFEGPYEKIKVIDNSTNEPINNTTQQVKSTITSSILATYENKKEYIFIQTLKARIVGCEWVLSELIPDIVFQGITMENHWCELHQKYDDCQIDPTILAKLASEEGDGSGGYGYGETLPQSLETIAGLPSNLIISSTGLPRTDKLPKFIRDILMSTKEDGTTILNL